MNIPKLINEIEHDGKFVVLDRQQYMRLYQSTQGKDCTCGHYGSEFECTKDCERTHKKNMKKEIEAMEKHCKQRRVKVYSKDEYGKNESFILSAPIFFANRPSARLDKVEFIDEDENVLQVFNDSPKVIETRDAFRSIETQMELMKQ